MAPTKIKIRFYTVPQAACGSSQMSWMDVAGMVNNMLLNHFNDLVEFDHVEFMDEKWFSDSQPQELLDKGTVIFPFVMVNDEVVCSEKKVNISKIRKYIQKELNS